MTKIEYLLFPGRHHLLTNFQREELIRITGADLHTLKDVNGNELGLEGKINKIIWPVTSANHSNTRRNPLPANRREVAIENFAQGFNAESFVYGIDDMGATPHFAEYVLKKIEVDSNGKFRLTPQNTVIGCSTPGVIEMYEKLGFKVLPFELTDRKKEKYCANRPWDLVNMVVKAGKEGRDWRKDPAYLKEVSEASKKLFEKYGYGNLIIDLHSDPLFATADGDITKTRNYNTYVRSFDEGAERKYKLIKDFVMPGRISDIGSCTGALIRQLTLDDRFRESDFYGIEAARVLYNRSITRKQEEGYFANDNVFFYQRNVVEGRIFPKEAPVNTFISTALTHEIESYQGRKKLEKLMSLIYDQLAVRGRWINVDVVGPENKEEIVYMKLSKEDGRNSDYKKKFKSKQREELRRYLEGLSTYGRFKRFVKDFRHEEGYSVDYELIKSKINKKEDYVKLKLKDACEFTSKKDFTDNEQSEMHETFCFWSFSEWKEAAEKAGFKVHQGSYAFTNPWIVENRLKGKVELYQKTGKELKRMEYPATTMVLVCEKR